MDYISAKQAAEKWNTHVRVVQEHCKAGRIPGAKRLERAWMIPSDAEKPEDLRRTRRNSGQVSRQAETASAKGVQSAAKQSEPAYLTCVLLSAVIPMPKENPDAVLSTLPDDGQRSQYAAELAYLRGDFDAVKSYFAGVSKEDATYLCAADITICAAMATRDYTLFKQITQSVKKLEQHTRSSDTRLAASLVPVLAAVCMNAPHMAPTWLRNSDFTAFPIDARPMLVFMQIKYLQSMKEQNGMLAAAQTARNLYRREDAFTLVDIYLTCFCACAYYALGQMDQTQDYLHQSVELCADGGFVSPLGEYTTWVGGLLEIALKKSNPAFEQAVLAHIEGTLKNWLFFHNEYAKDNASLLLTTKEYQLAVLLKEGKTYEQAASQLCLSVGRIRNLVSVIYEKLGISKKADIKRFVY
ncbi:MAG: hypothetical protein Q4G60_11870 [bacterium]|nr:hypothetical protein [bacterium]